MAIKQATIDRLLLSFERGFTAGLEEGLRRAGEQNKAWSAATHQELARIKEESKNTGDEA